MASYKVLWDYWIEKVFFFFSSLALDCTKSKSHVHFTLFNREAFKNITLAQRFQVSLDKPKYVIEMFQKQPNYQIQISWCVINADMMTLAVNLFSVWLPALALVWSGVVELLSAHSLASGQIWLTLEESVVNSELLYQHIPYLSYLSRFGTCTIMNCGSCLLVERYQYEIVCHKRPEPSNLGIEPRVYLQQCYTLIHSV